jgi:protein gp37
LRGLEPPKRKLFTWAKTAPFHGQTTPSILGGCTKVSPGCDHCYAESDFDHRKHRVKWGAGMPRSRTTSTWHNPVKWNREAAATGYRPRVFCASLADVFDNEVDPQWRADLWALIRETPLLRWMVLTKRIGNVARMVPADWPFPGRVRCRRTRACPAYEPRRLQPERTAQAVRHAPRVVKALGSGLN